MMMQKWNYITKTYDPYTVPDGWNVTMLDSDMDARINCASCGSDLRYGDSFTSRLIHNPSGFGYCICPKCHEKEVKEELQHKNDLDFVVKHCTNIQPEYFSSVKEFTRYLELSQMLKEETITNLKIHPEFTLLDSYIDTKGIRIRPIRYTISFSYELAFTSQAVYEVDANLSSNYDKMEQDFSDCLGIHLTQI